MNVSDYFLEVAATYDRREAMSSSAQNTLKRAPELLAEHAPAGIFIQGSGGKGLATYTPWVGFFNPDETDTPQRGLYVVYLFSEDMERLVLTLNQGMEYLRRRHGDTRARALLARDAEAIRTRLPAETVASLTDSIDLRSKGLRQQAYEAGNIACRIYDAGLLPPESAMRADLGDFLALYDAAIEIKRSLLLAVPGEISSPGEPQTTTDQDPLANFRPRSDGEYRAVLVGRELVKTRRHERLVADFGRYCSTRDFEVATQHPRDLVLRRRGSTYLVEAKVLYKGNATEAVRAAIGQLLTYAHFLYDHDTQPRKVALFTEPIGEAYVKFLEANHVAVVWWEEGHWRGSEAAAAGGIV